MGLNALSRLNLLIVGFICGFLNYAT